MTREEIALAVLPTLLSRIGLTYPAVHVISDAFTLADVFAQYARTQPLDLCIKAGRADCPCHACIEARLRGKA